MLELFTNPGYLAIGLAAISIPIIIHLINRMRFKRLRWAAMEFLLKSQKRNRRRLIIEQLLLLALRCLLVAMIALLVSRMIDFPEWFRDAWNGFPLTRAIAELKSAETARADLHVVVLDDTLSMKNQWKEGDEPKDCFGVAGTDVLLGRIVKKLGQAKSNERLVILQLSRLATERGQYEPHAYQRLNDAETLKKVTEDVTVLQASFLHVDLLQGVKKAQQIIGELPAEKASARLYLLSDFRQSDCGLPQGESLNQALAQLARSKVKVRLVDTAYPYRNVGQGGMPPSHDNVGIVDFRAGTRIAGKDMPVTFTVTLANYSAREAQVNVAIFNDADGSEMHQVDFNPPMPLKVPAGSTNTTVTFDLRFHPQIKADEAYYAQISARLQSAQRGKLENDGLADDNVRHAAVEIRNKVPILVVDGEGKRGREENQDSYFIRNAIISVPGSSYEVVFADELGGGLPAKALERSDLHQYPTIFLLNVRELTPKQQANLENYLREGGGVAFFLGPQVSAHYYNKELYKGGKGLFPVPLRETYFPSANDEPLKGEYSGEYNLLLRDDLFPNIDTFPIFGPVFKEREQREFLKNLPVKRYFQVPRSEWRPEPGKVEELATLPNEQPITAYQRAALEIVQGPVLTRLLEQDEYMEYRRGIERHRRIVETLVGPTSEKKAYHLARALDEMLHDKGKEKERPEFPNLTEFWANSDPKIRSLRDDVVQLHNQVLYGDPFVVHGLFGKGKVVAVMTTAGKDWNDWGGGSDAALIYQPFIWELQNYLSSQGAESLLTVGTPVQIAVDSEPFKGKQQLKMVRYYHKAEQGKAVQIVKESEQFGKDDKGILTFSFDKSLEPGLYVSQLVYADSKQPLASWAQVFNVDTPREGKLQRVSGDELDKNLLRLPDLPPEAIKLMSPQELDEELVAPEDEVVTRPWYFLLLLLILVSEQALAVHLSFHLKGSEAEMPAQATRRAA